MADNKKSSGKSYCHEKFYFASSYSMKCQKLTLECTSNVLINRIKYDFLRTIVIFFKQQKNIRLYFDECLRSAFNK
jgi:hypothetical protein